MNIFDINNIVFTAWGYGVCWLELIGFITGFIAIYLAGRSNVLTFWIGLLNCAAFLALFWQQHLYSMMLLQVIFAIINIYGIVRWTLPKHTQHEELRISRLSPQALVGVLLFIVFGSIAWYSAIGTMAQRFPDIFSEPQYPFVDAMLLVSNVVGQWLLARKKIENWYLWVLADVTACILWLVMGLYLTAILYILYLIITYNALREWHRQMRADTTAKPNRKL
ncbi:MAG: nicotinamide riboside transporter PnuC [Paludibacteraceae bacterium]